MSYDLIQEEFGSLNELLKTINSRPNSHFMRNEHSSSKNGASFTGTKSYEEAVSLLKYGYDEPIPEIKKKLREGKRVSSKIYSSLPHPIPKNKVAGFIPNVPNAIRGLPESMITIEKVNQKRKTLSIIYSFGSCGGTDQEKLLKAGIALVSAINIVEMSGIQTELEVGFMGTTQRPDAEEGEVVFPTVRIKNYGERFSLQKVTFPMINPSMFRRIGFKYLETCHLCKEDYSSGYGCVPSMKVLERLFDAPDTKVISSDWIIKHDYDVEKILEKIGVRV